MNIKTINKFSYLHLIFAILTISIYCVGYIFKDYAPGGGPEDFTNFIWRNINSFQDDLGNSIINYSKMADANFPGFYIISSLNPFAYSVSSFHLFSFSLGFLTFIIFGLILYEKDNYNNLITNFSISSLILILPFFITRAYWGTSAGLAWFLLVCLVFYLNKIKVLLIKNENITIVHIFIICLLSSLLLYVRASYVFFALYLFLYFLLIIKKNHITLASLIFFSFFSIPGFYLIYIWVNQPLGNINVINVISLKNIFLNFPIFTSYFAFYLFPILVIGIKHLNKYIFYKYLKIFSLVFIVYLVLFMMGKFEYLSNYEFSGGAILKLNYMLIDGNYLLLLISSMIGCCLLSNFLKENFLENIILILPIFLIYGLTDYPFQDYFEPLILILFFSGLLNSSLYKFYYKNKEAVFYSSFIYFLSFLSFSVYFKNFTD